MSNPIPEALRPAVDRALMAAFGTAELDAIAPLSGGLSGAAVFRIRVGGIAYALLSSAIVPVSKSVMG